MSDNTPRLGIAELAQMQEMDAATINEAFVRLDALSDVYLLGQYVNTPPVSPADGDTYITGGAPTGAWTGYAYKIAYCIDGGWRFFTPFNGLRAFVASSNAFLAYQAGSWIDANALIGAAETSIASAATCDLGAAGALFVQVTGTTAITGLGSGTNLLRFVRFAGALTLTHNATSLILPGGGDIATIAGDCAIFTSDASVNWRCHSYQRATLAARAADSSQLEANWKRTGLMSVWPSTRNTQLMSDGIALPISIRVWARSASRCLPASSSVAEPDGNSSSDWNTKRSPTIFTSGRLPNASRTRPKNSYL